VECDLGNVEAGSAFVCSEKDLKDGNCFNGFQEYESTALFCSALDVNNGDCNDDTIIATNNIVVNAVDESAKWLSMLDLSSSASSTHIMYLLTDDKSTEVDEGVLTNPMLNVFDNSIEGLDADNLLGQLNGNVEAVQSGWVSNDEVARFDVINQEVKLIDQVLNNVSNIYMVTDPKLDNVNDDSLNKQVINVGEVNFPRLITQLETIKE
jgi:hypothetical protein